MATALEHACNEVAKQTESCPFELYDWPSSICSPETCQSNLVACWKEYFEMKARRNNEQA